MMKYLLGLGALVVLVVGYAVLATPVPTTAAIPAPVLDVPAAELAPVSPPASAPVAPVAVAPAENVPQQAATTAVATEDTVLQQMAANARERLPFAVTDTLTQTDALFFPRMRIMEYSYVTTAADARAAARDLRATIESRARTICTEGRDMFAMGVTLRNSFEDRAGNVLQRVYLLPEDCRRFD